MGQARLRNRRALDFCLGANRKSVGLQEKGLPIIFQLPTISLTYSDLSLKKRCMEAKVVIQYSGSGELKRWKPARHNYKEIKVFKPLISQCVLTLPNTSILT